MKPLLIYDGDCHFCRRWIARWEETTGDKVDYESSQHAAARFPDIAGGDFDEAVQWIAADGRRTSGAPAVFSALATSSWQGKFLLWLHRHAPGFSFLADAVYRDVARRRSFFSLLTRLLWGGDVRRPRYGLSTRVFLHALGLIYLIAFASYWVQLGGLVGAQGIAPAAVYFQRAGEVLGSGGFWQLPSFGWWGASDAALTAWCVAGVVVAALLTAGLLPGPCLIFLWANYLSLSIAGQEFYQFQWDTLLLEVGFLSIFLAPWTWRLRGLIAPPRAAHFLLVWLLFRLMFAAGVVKLSSGDPAWADGTALDFHYFTQPLPTPLAWYAQQLPGWWQWVSVKIMFAIELACPFLLFGPRNIRLLGVAGIAWLQVLIALTGNYGFFNLLALALCLLAVDDTVWQRRSLPAENRHFLHRWAMSPLAVVLFLLSLPPLAASFRQPIPWLEPLARAYDAIVPFRTINGYGLFAVMTTERHEITVQGSDDGYSWKTYVFRYKPGDPKKAPPWVAPYMPRLDWQMWFAALGRMENNPWFGGFLLRLLQGSPDVLALLAENPFPDKPPRYVRALTDDYTFTTKNQPGAWWNVEPRGTYCPQVSLR